MAKILATKIRIGHFLEWDKHLWKVANYCVRLDGRGGAYMQVKMKVMERA